MRKRLCNENIIILSNLFSSGSRSHDPSLGGTLRKLHRSPLTAAHAGQRLLTRCSYAERRDADETKRLSFAFRAAVPALYGAFREALGNIKPQRVCDGICGIWGKKATPLNLASAPLSRRTGVCGESHLYSIRAGCSRQPQHIRLRHVDSVS